MNRLATFLDMGHLREDLTNKPVKFWPFKWHYLIIYKPISPIEIVRILSGLRDIISLNRLSWLSLKKRCTGQRIKKRYKSIYSDVDVPRFMGIDSRLSYKEGKILYFSAMGKANKRIARLVKVGIRQVERYRASIFQKLAYNNIAAAVMQGMRFTEIQPFLKQDEHVEEI